MRLGVVIRSVAILLAAPLLALPAGGAEDDQPSPQVVGLRPAIAHAKTEQAGGRSSDETASKPRQAQPPPQPSSPVRVVVDCAKDGCVVQNGLDVLVVGP
jgi:hypothetical protein